MNKMVEDHCRKIEDQCTKIKEMGIKMLPPIQDYVNDNDVSIDGIQYECVNEDLTNVSNGQITECEPEDRVMNSRIDSCFAMSSNQNKMKKETVKVTENGIEGNRKEDRVINVDRVNQLIAPLRTRSERKVLSNIKQINKGMTSHLNISTLT